MSGRFVPARQLEDEWEYEYDGNEKEVFLVDIDLTTTNRVIKAASATKAKRLLNPATPKPKSKPVANGRKRQALNPTDKGDAPTPTQEQQYEQIEAEEEVQEERSETTGDTIQILDLHTSNPLVSYHGHLYSCNWVDMVGTNMFFTEHQDTPLFDPELATDEYDLVGTSRIKLVGQQATLKPKPAPAPGTQSNKKVEPAGKSLGTIRRNNAHLNIALRKQANFLEQLMSIKKERGEPDSVRVVVNAKTVRALDSGSGFDSGKQRAEIERLNARVVKGDKEAYDKLEDMYCGRDSDESDEDVTFVSVNPAHGAATTTTHDPRPASDSISRVALEVDTLHDDSTNVENG